MEKLTAILGVVNAVLFFIFLLGIVSLGIGYFYFRKDCPRCDGTGFRPSRGALDEECVWCHGSGKIEE